jgi:peptide/nickel transport system substrate-binding protein
VDEASSPGPVDPGTAYDNNAGEIAQNTNLPLVFYYGNSTTTIDPIIAQSWNSSANGLTYTFFLRNNVYYDNGNPVNAYVVWYNYYRDMFINQGADFVLFSFFNTSGVTVGDINSLDNAQNSPSGNATLLGIMENSSNSITVLNSTAVQFHLISPQVWFLPAVTYTPFDLADPYVVQQNGGVLLNQPNSWMSVNGTNVGDGPYITQTLVPNQYTILVANPNYWAQNITNIPLLQPASIKEIIINYKTDELTRELDLESGKAQGAIISFNDLKDVVNVSNPTLNLPNIGLSTSLEFVSIDTLRAPTNNSLVRQAIVAAINVSQIESIVYDGYSSPMVGPDPLGVPGYNSSIQAPQYNLTLAKQLLVQAGYPNGKGLPPINFVYFQSAYISLVAQLLQADLSQIGITLMPQQVTFGVWVSDIGIPGENSTAPSMEYGSWTAFPDFSLYGYIVDGQLGAFGFMNNQTINQLVSESNTQLNQTLRAEEISQITVDTLQQSSVIWLGQDQDLYSTGGGFGPTVWNTCVSGLYYNAAFDGVPFNTLHYTCTPT